MKKIFLFLCVLFCSFPLWAGYGILVNGCEYYEGTLNPTPGDPSFTEYMANVAISNGDYCQLYDASTQAKWAVDLDSYSVAGFTRNGDKYNCTTSGNFLFVIKLKFEQDQLYIGPAAQADQPQNICPTTGFCIAGNGVAGNPWVCGLAWDSAGCPLGTTNSITFDNVPAGSYLFKITNGTWRQSWGGAYMDATLSTPGYATDKDGNVTFKIAQTANITISFDGKKIVMTSTQPLQPVYVSSVPSQCTDVLMQGFYFNSYEVNDTIGNGTDIYGDTKWKTLYTQSSEIGAYFDLIWLPPSALASGTGYHPRQYSNQNSDWGTRQQLEDLIAGFHNQGTKVVADMVLNHAEAMGGWCDMSKQNFGQYGVYEPTVGWICKTDEMNESWTKYDSLAGDCWGKASGPDDDGTNYAAARDWAHNKDSVREMFRAYSKWMRNVMKYDGFRYDECKGYHNSHIDDYNQAGEAYISFMEYWSGNSDITTAIHNARYNTMSLDFMSKYKAFDGISQFNYSLCQINNGTEQDPWNNRGLIGCGWNEASQSKWSKFAITFVDSHDWFYRGNGQEFGANGGGKEKNGISMTDGMKDRLLQAIAYQLSAPGVPCVFYPHWKKYKEYIKPMIDARHLAGVHSECDVEDEEVSNSGYKATFKGKYGNLILFLGDKTTHSATGQYQWLADNGYVEVAGGNGYAMWVVSSQKLAPELIITPNADFWDAAVGIDVELRSEGGLGQPRVIYYTTDGTEPTLESDTIHDHGTLNFKQTTVLKAMAVCDGAQSRVLTYTYTYHEKPVTGIKIRFNKPEVWDKAYIYAWKPLGQDSSINILGAHPGQRLYQDEEGWYSYEFDETMDSVNFYINSGDDCGGLNIQSNNLVAYFDRCYGWLEGAEEVTRQEQDIDCSTEINPDFDLVISPESGQFRDQTEGQKVQINVVGRPGALIYYTTDGSDPATCLEPATDTISFVLHADAVVRAYAYDPATKETTSTYQNVFQYKAPQSGPITVRFIQPKDVIDPTTGDTISKAWKDLYLYAFTRVKGKKGFIDTPYSLDGKSPAWPGMKWTTTVLDAKGIEWHTWTMKSDIKEIYVIFTEGKNRPQTQDIYLIEDMCYLWNIACGRAVANPQCDGVIPEGLEAVAVDEVEQTGNKFIYHDQLYIRVGDQVYDIFGRPIHSPLR